MSSDRVCFLPPPETASPVSPRHPPPSGHSGDDWREREREEIAKLEKDPTEVEQEQEEDTGCWRGGEDRKSGRTVCIGCYFRCYDLKKTSVVGM